MKGQTKDERILNEIKQFPAGISGIFSTNKKTQRQTVTISTELKKSELKPTLILDVTCYPFQQPEPILDKNIWRCTFLKDQTLTSRSLLQVFEAFMKQQNLLGDQFEQLQWAYKNNMICWFWKVK
jgi:hypothetical protein